jgi:hypothetical protein
MIDLEKPEPDFVPRGVVTAPQIWAAAYELLSTAAETCSFVSMQYPVWDGWASARMVATRLPWQLMQARYAKAEEDTDCEGYYHVETVLMAAATLGRLEKRCYRPFAPDPVDEVRNDVEEWQFRLPGDNGHCFWCPDQPLGAPPDADDYDSHLARAMRSRQIVDLSERLRRMDSEIPPYAIARTERYMSHPSRGNKRISW